MKLFMLLALVSLSSFVFANEVIMSRDKIDCSAKINRTSTPLVYDADLKILTVSKDGLNVSVRGLIVKKQILATVSADVEGKDLFSQTKAMPVSKKSDKDSFMALFDFGAEGKVSVFCTLKNI